MVLPHRLITTLLSMLLLPGCADEIQGRLRLLVVPLHEGRDTIQNPFEQVELVEIGITDQTGEFRTIGEDKPNTRFGPGLTQLQLTGSPTLIGYQSRNLPRARGFGPIVTLRPSLNQYISLPFQTIEHARASHKPNDPADPFLNRPPSLVLDQTNLEQGQLDSEADAGCTATLVWSDKRLDLSLKVRDDDIQPASQGALDQGDAIVVFLDGKADGLADGVDDYVITISASGEVNPPEPDFQIDMQTRADGYDLTLQVPLFQSAKNSTVGFDLRQIDYDGQETPTWLTWVFDRGKTSKNPQVDQYGKLVLGVPLLDLLKNSSTSLQLELADGPLVISGSWDDTSIRFTTDIRDDEIIQTEEESDQLEFWFDLANGEPPIAETNRFFRLTVPAAGQATLAGGPDPQNVSTAGVAFSGQADCVVKQNGYVCQIVLPFSDLQFISAVQAGWFLGLEIVAQDVDNSSQVRTSWSGSPERADRWGELRLYPKDW